MIRRSVWVKTAAFVVIAVLGVSYVLLHYIGAGQSVFGSGYTAYVDLPDSGGLFTSASVTYRGVEIGRVAHVLADADADIFDGIVIDVSRGPGGHRFVDAPYVANIATGGVTLTLDAAAAEALPEPSENPAEMAADPTEGHEGGLTRKLRRAWDMISGKY